MPVRKANPERGHTVVASRAGTGEEVRGTLIEGTTDGGYGLVVGADDVYPVDAATLRRA